MQLVVDRNRLAAAEARGRKLEKSSAANDEEASRRECQLSSDDIQRAGKSVKGNSLPVLRNPSTTPSLIATCNDAGPSAIAVPTCSKELLTCDPLMKDGTAHCTSSCYPVH